MRVLVLGGTGFIGRATAPALLGHEVTTVSRAHDAGRRLDAGDSEALSAVVAHQPFDVVVNLLGAGLSAGSADEATMQSVNAELPPRLIELCADLAIRPHIVHAASSTERLPGQTEDESAYSRSKHEGTSRLRAAAHSADVPVTILTIHNTYGPGQPPQRFIAAVIKSLRDSETVALNYPQRVRDFVFVDDVAASIARAVEQRPVGVVEAEIGTGVGLSLLECAVEIARQLGVSDELVSTSPVHPPDPNPITVCPVRFGTYGACTTDFASGIRKVLEAR